MEDRFRGVDGHSRVDKGRSRAQEGRSLGVDRQSRAVEGRSQADEGRYQADEGRSQAGKGPCRADNGQSRDDEGWCRTDGERVRLHERGLWLTRDSLKQRAESRTAGGRSLSARQPPADERRTRDDERWTLAAGRSADALWTQHGEGQYRDGEGRSLSDE